MKRVFWVLLSFILILSFTSCKNDSDVTPEENEVTEIYSDIITETVDSEDISVTTSADNSSEVSTNAETSTDEAADPANWSTEQIIDAYKKAAQKSNSKVKSAHGIELKKVSVNDDEIDFIIPIMQKLLENNSEEKDGITGGFNKLNSSDVKSAKAYRSGNNTVIELVMKDQVSGAREDALEGSVGHAITAVGDIGVVVDQLTDLGLPLEISDKDTKIYYTDATVKVVINPSGEIVNGTWRYTVDINLNNYKAFGQDVKTTSVVMVNSLTVNGGFKK